MRCGRPWGVLGGVVVSGLILLAPANASATVAGPCDVEVAGQPIDEGHDTPETAVRVPAGRDISVDGTVGSPESPGSALSVAYGVTFGGPVFDYSHVGNETGWTSAIPLSDFAWASVGLFLVRMEVDTSKGSCTGAVYLCIEGKSPLLTVLGGTAILAGMGGLLLLGVTIRHLRRLHAVRAAFQSFLGEAMVASAASLLLQQTCVGQYDLSSALIVPVAVGVLAAAVVATAGTMLGRPDPA